jgi:hypothetical protein
MRYRTVEVALLVAALVAGCGDDAASSVGSTGAGASSQGGGAQGGSSQGGAGAGGGAQAACVERNSPEELAARDGFVEVCAPADHPRAVCGDGTPYRFSVRPAEGPSAGLLVYFRGGGNCNDYISCWGKDGQGGAGRRVGTLTNDSTSPEILPALGRTFGFFDEVDPTALFPDFDIVYASYCSGDGGLQSTETTFDRPVDADPAAPASITTYFRGVDNRRAVVAAALERFPSPARIAIVGSSAGSYAAMGAVPELVAAFDDVTDVTYYGEGGIGVGRPEYSALVDDTIAQHDGEAGRPLVRFVQFSFDADATQRDYAPAPFGDAAMFRDEVVRLVADREAAHPGNFRSIVWPGSCHTLALNVALYQAFEQVNGKWKPVVPAVRPNPFLVLDGASLVETIRTATRGSGPLDFASIASSAIGTSCPMPGG